MKLQPNLRKTEFAWEKPVSEQCKQKVENCSCGHASCIFTGVQKHDIIDICCEEQYEFKCCPDESSFVKMPKPVPVRDTKECRAVFENDNCYKKLKAFDQVDRAFKGLSPSEHSCIKDETQMATACCEEGYRFEFFLNPEKNRFAEYVGFDTLRYMDYTRQFAYSIVETEECKAMIKEMNCSCPDYPDKEPHLCSPIDRTDMGSTIEMAPPPLSSLRRPPGSSAFPSRGTSADAATMIIIRN
uniref:Uncharacterized protein n=1 Tax=Globodera pallida TaxID=36090 RepID=A0A183CHE4_GLOPA